MDHTMWKSIKNCARKWCPKLCAFLFAATWAFGKMCLICPTSNNCISLGFYFFQANLSFGGRATITGGETRLCRRRTTPIWRHLDFTRIKRWLKSQVQNLEVPLNKIKALQLRRSFCGWVTTTRTGVSFSGHLIHPTHLSWFAWARTHTEMTSGRLTINKGFSRGIFCVAIRPNHE